MLLQCIVWKLVSLLPNTAPFPLWRYTANGPWDILQWLLTHHEGADGSWLWELVRIRISWPEMRIRLCVSRRCASHRRALTAAYKRAKTQQIWTPGSSLTRFHVPRQILRPCEAALTLLALQRLCIGSFSNNVAHYRYGASSSVMHADSAGGQARRKASTLTCLGLCGTWHGCPGAEVRPPNTLVHPIHSTFTCVFRTASRAAARPWALDARRSGAIDHSHMQMEPKDVHHDNVVSCDMQSPPTSPHHVATRSY